jgi:TDG/mug DNA glycosylase family protein
MHTLPDHLRTHLRLVFVGFNPGTRSAAIGHYYAGRGNLFWPLLYESELLPEPLTYAEDQRVLEFGIGLTDLVKRSTPSSADLTTAEARAGAEVLQGKLLTYAPRVICFNGKGVYAWYSRQRSIVLGPQEMPVGTSRVFVAPSTSGRNGSVSRMDKAEAFRALARFVEAQTRSVPSNP